MTETMEPTKSGFVRFWTSLPGMFTAIAGLITAGTGVYFATQDQHRSEPSSYVINLEMPPGATPPSGTYEAGSLDLSSYANIPLGDASSMDDIDYCAAGDLAACERLLDGLVLECDAGYGVSCDALFAVAPAGSDYEWFGATCGARLDETYAGQCQSA
jgi:hypothetical protein